eukprot:1193949-Prorocentrum_minimum.AAC.1
MHKAGQGARKGDTVAGLAGGSVPGSPRSLRLAVLSQTVASRFVVSTNESKKVLVSSPATTNLLTTEY